MFTLGCLKCNTDIISGVNRADDKGSQCIECHEDMYLVYTREGTFHVAGDYDLVSDSLAVPPTQIAEHRANFPDIDMDECGRPHFTSFSQHDKYLGKAGFVKQPGMHNKYSKGSGVFRKRYKNIPTEGQGIPYGELKDDM